MYKRLFFAKSFWNTKLGQAAFASIAAMSAMVVMTTQFGPGEAHAAPMAQPQAELGISVELA